MTETIKPPSTGYAVCYSEYVHIRFRSPGMWLFVCEWEAYDVL